MVEDVLIQPEELVTTRLYPPAKVSVILVYVAPKTLIPFLFHWKVDEFVINELRVNDCPLQIIDGLLFTIETVGLGLTLIIISSLFWQPFKPIPVNVYVLLIVG